MSYLNLPDLVISLFAKMKESPLLVLTFINITLLVAGIFMDMTPAVLIFTPIFLPLAQNIGIDPVHLGIVMVMNLSIGLCTPPVGSILFVGCSVAEVRIADVIRPLIPYYLGMIAVLMLVTWIPLIRAELGVLAHLGRRFTVEIHPGVQ